MLIDVFGHIKIVCTFARPETRENCGAISCIVAAINGSDSGKNLARIEFTPALITAEFIAGSNVGKNLSECTLAIAELFKSIPIITGLKELSTSHEFQGRTLDATIDALRLAVAASEVG